MSKIAHNDISQIAHNNISQISHNNMSQIIHTNINNLRSSETYVNCFKFLTGIKLYLQPN